VIKKNDLGEMMEEEDHGQRHLWGREEKPQALGPTIPARATKKVEISTGSTLMGDSERG